MLADIRRAIEQTLMRKGEWSIGRSHRLSMLSRGLEWLQPEYSMRSLYSNTVLHQTGPSLSEGQRDVVKMLRSRLGLKS